MSEFERLPRSISIILPRTAGIAEVRARSEASDEPLAISASDAAIRTGAKRGVMSFLTTVRASRRQENNRLGDTHGDARPRPPSRQVPVSPR